MVLDVEMTGTRGRARRARCRAGMLRALLASSLMSCGAGSGPKSPPSGSPSSDRDAGATSPAPPTPPVATVAPRRPSSPDPEVCKQACPAGQVRTGYYQCRRTAGIAPSRDNNNYQPTGTIACPGTNVLPAWFSCPGGWDVVAACGKPAPAGTCEVSWQGQTVECCVKRPARRCSVPECAARGGSCVAGPCSGDTTCVVPGS